MRFAATAFVQILKRKPGLETAAFLIVGWVGVKLAVYTLAHPALNVIPHSFPESTPWKLTFWIVLVGIAAGGWFFSKEVETKSRKEFRRKSAVITALFLFYPSPTQCPEKFYYTIFCKRFLNICMSFFVKHCTNLLKLRQNRCTFIHIRSIYPALMGSKTPPQNSAKTKKLGGYQLPIKARLVRADNQWEMKKPPTD